MQLSPRPSDRGAHLPPSYIETILEMKSAHLDYDDRDKGDYEPAPKRTRIDKGDDGHDDFYDERRSTPRLQSCRDGQSHRNSSRSRSPIRGRDRSYRRSRSPARGPRQSHAYGRDRNHSRSRSRTRRYEQSPRGRNGGSRGIPEPAQRDVVWKQDVTQEEKKRGQRLFGGLLANLGGPAVRARPAAGRGPSGAASQRNERPASTERQHLDPDSTGKVETAATKQAEDDGGKKAAQRLAKLDLIRKIEQVRFDEQKMHALHANNLALARSLCTRNKPCLYYHPRHLLKTQQETIEGQLREAEQNAAQQRQSFEREKLERLSALGVRYTPKGAAAEAPTTPEQAQRDSQSAAETHADTAPLDLDAMVDEPAEQEGAEPDGRQEDGIEDINEPQGERKSGSKATQHVHEELLGHHDERDKDVMVETEEDTVIY